MTAGQSKPVCTLFIIKPSRPHLTAMANVWCAQSIGGGAVRVCGGSGSGVQQCTTHTTTHTTTQTHTRQPTRHHRHTHICIHTHTNTTPHTCVCVCLPCDCAQPDGAGSCWLRLCPQSCASEPPYPALAHTTATMHTALLFVSSHLHAQAARLQWGSRLAAQQQSTALV